PPSTAIWNWPSSTGMASMCSSSPAAASPMAGSTPAPVNGSACCRRIGAHGGKALHREGPRASLAHARDRRLGPPTSPRRKPGSTTGRQISDSVMDSGFRRNDGIELQTRPDLEFLDLAARDGDAAVHAGG